MDRQRIDRLKNPRLRSCHDPNDGRVQHIRLTTAGRKITERVSPPQGPGLDEKFEAPLRSELETLSDLWRKLGFRSSTTYTRLANGTRYILDPRQSFHRERRSRPSLAASKYVVRSSVRSSSIASSLGISECGSLGRLGPSKPCCETNRGRPVKLEEELRRRLLYALRGFEQLGVGPAGLREQVRRRLRPPVGGHRR